MAQETDKTIEFPIFTLVDDNGNEVIDREKTLATEKIILEQLNQIRKDESND